MTSEASSLRQRAAVALLWSGFGQYGSNLIRLASILVLGWLLPPSDFGLLALSLIFVVFAEGIGALGMVSTLVQEKTLDQRVLDTAFWGNLALNCVLAAFTLLWAEPITAFLGDSGASPLLTLLSALFVVNALETVPKALLTRRLRFRELSATQLVGEIGFLLVGVGMALLGFGFWSLGSAILVQRALTAALVWRKAGWRPGLSMDLATLRRLGGFGGAIMAGALVDRGLLNVDYFIIGRYIGTEPLGYYSLAFQLAFIPLDRAVGSMGRVAFPVFSEVQEDPRRLRAGLLESLRHLYNLTVPIALCIVVLGPWLLRAIYGTKWDPSLVPIRILGLAGLCLAPRLVEWAILAIGRPEVRLSLKLVRLAAFALLVGTVGLSHGVNGVAASVAGALAVWAVATLWVGSRMLGISRQALTAELGPTIRAGLVALVPLAIFLAPPARELSAWLRIVYGGGTMMAVYLALVLPQYRNLLGSRRQG